MIKIPNEIYNAQREYIESARKFIKGEMELNDFKHHASPFGVYAQKTKDTYMIRPRIFSGVLSLDQLKFIANLSEKYCNGLIHLTTRQDIQFHKLSLEDTIEIFERLSEANLISKGAGGNGIRNITCSPLSGVEIEEIFDVTHHAEKATEFILGLDGITELPRKYKIAFSNSNRDTARARFSDLGFIAKLKDGRRGFEVYAGGGLGSSSDDAMLLEEYIYEEEILDYINAMKKLFEDHGDRTNRSKARIRHIKQRLGVEEFKQLFEDYYKTLETRTKYYSNEYVNEELYTQKDEYSDSRVVKQKQSDLYALYIHPECGDLKTDDLNLILDLIYKLDYDLEFRLTSTQGLYIRNIKCEHMNDFIDRIDSFTKSSIIESSVACTGSKNCKIGLQDSQDLLKKINAALESLDETEKQTLPRIYISGCHNSCGWHHIGALGFSGTVLKDKNGTHPAFRVHIGGRVLGFSRIANEIGVLKVDDIPDFVLKLAKLFKKSDYESFDDFIENKDAIGVSKLLEG